MKDIIKVTWSLVDQKNKGGKNWYVSLSWLDTEHKRHQKMKSTGIPLKGNNIRKAKDIAKIIATEYENQLNTEAEAVKKHLFSDFMLEWLSIERNSLKESTYDVYLLGIRNCIKPYFDGINAELETLTAQHIQGYYQTLLDRGLSANTVRKRHANISKALKWAIKQRLITYNPIDGVVLPKITRHEADVFTLEQLQTILKAVHGEQIETAVYLGACCGLRRSEALGLTWGCIDFKNNLMHIKQTKTKITKELFELDTKSRSSKRTLPLDDKIKSILIAEKERQDTYKSLFGSSYDINDFVCKYTDGRPLKCDYLSKRFKAILNKLKINGSYHSLRHTAATLMCNSGVVNIKTVSDYLGHSDIATTTIYMHPDIKSKLQASNILSQLIRTTE